MTLRSSLRILITVTMLALPLIPTGPALCAEAPAEPGPEVAETDQQNPEPVRLTVADCILIALRNNVELRRGYLGDEQSELDRISALAQFLPSLSASGEYQRSSSDGSGADYDRSGSATLSGRTPWGTSYSGTFTQGRSNYNSSDDISNSSSVRAQLRQPLLYGAGTTASYYGYRSARHSRVASRQELIRTRQLTAYNIRQSYWSAVEAQLQIKANRRALKSARYFLEATNARLKAERASKLDVSNAEIQCSSREVALTRAESRLEEVLDSLKQDMDLELTDRITTVSSPEYRAIPRDPAGLASTILKNRPDLRAARERLAIKELDLARKKRNAWPDLDLVAGYTFSGSGDDTDDSHNYNDRNASIGLEVSIPLGMIQRRNELKKATIDLRREQLLLHSREVAVRRELRSVLRDLKAAESNLASFGKRVEAARLATAAARALYERGKGTSFDVIRAEDDLLEAELGLAQSQSSCLRLQAQVDLVVGRPVTELTRAHRPDGSTGDKKHSAE